jgi:hypothetical protein
MNNDRQVVVGGADIFIVRVALICSGDKYARSQA